MGENYKIVRIKENQSFLRRHNRWFSFLSTIVVLGTFIVNEALRSDAKDLADSIGRAQTDFIERSEIETLSNQISRVGDAVGDILTKIERPKRHREVKQPTNEEIGTARIEEPLHLQDELEFNTILTLYEKIPYNRSLDDIHWELINGLNAESIFLNHAEVLAYRMEKGEHDLEDVKDVIAKDRSNVRDHRWRLTYLFALQPQGPGMSFEEGIEYFGESVVDKAKEDRESSEHKAQLWKKISFGLYPLGLIIGLAGKVSESGDSGGE